MANSRAVFVDIYDRITNWRFALVILLLIFGGFSIYFTNYIAKKLEERERVYIKLYVRSIETLFISEVNENVSPLISDVLAANETIPVIYVDENGDVRFQKNVLDSITDSPDKLNKLKSELPSMEAENKPIPLHFGEFERGYVYYYNSNLIRQLRYFPLIQIIAFLFLGSLAYIALSSSRKAEQNRVWVGLAKETAHQLGTPISAIMGWIELLKANPDFDQSIAHELTKDVERLDTVTKRFSSIGSVPTLTHEGVNDLVKTSMDYLQKRVSTKILFSFNSQIEDQQTVLINKNLLEWVIENLIKNAVDAMGGIGSINIHISELPKERISIDIEDTGKGISNLNLRKIFNPGFSTKSRGWGLGLTLAKRIVETYHSGRLFVKETVVGKGTTFRIILQKSK